VARAQLKATVSRVARPTTITDVAATAGDGRRRIPRAQPTSINDVARLAGVSPQTVSRALTGHPNVRQSTRVRVLAAAAQLQFRPNRAARVLRGGRSHTLGVLAVAAGWHYGPAMSIAAFEQAARERDYGVIVIRAASASRQAVAAAARELLAQHVDGALLVAPAAASLSGLTGLLAHLPVVAPHGVPQHPASVLAPSIPAPSIPAPSIPAPSIPAPSIDQRAGVRMLISHLVSLGHRHVLHLAGPPGWDDAEFRLRAYESELRLARLPALPPLAGDWSAASGFAAGRALLGSRPGRELGFSAVFAANDQMALGLVRAFHEAGIEVPRDVSVVGFDDIPQAAYFWPPLTTVRQDFDELGRRCLAALLAGGHGQPDAVAVPPLLVVRDSVAAPPAGA
jgi:DNA-binding LacI/PurR family transcriptional regulator